MPARRLEARHVERIWGVRELPHGFAPTAAAAEPIGEIWFEDVGPRPRCWSNICSPSERLSVQVHPDDAAARAAGHARGKDEAWYVLAAEPGAAIGLGLTHAVSRRGAARGRARRQHRAAARLAAGRAPATIFYSPAGTVHAIGGGLSLIEIQQNLDLTYRLYDYGRPRELHLDEAVAVADPGPWSPPSEPVEAAPGRTILAARRRLRARALDRARGASDRRGGASCRSRADGSIDGEALEAGTVWRVDGTRRDRRRRCAGRLSGAAPAR